MSRVNTLGKAALSIIALGILAIAILTLRDALRGAQIAATFPGEGGTAGAFGKVGVEFKQAMNTCEVEKRIEITPEVPGSLTWEGNTVWFTPRQAWQEGVIYHFRLRAGAPALDGRKVARETTIRFSIRQPEIIYLSTREKALELWSIPASGGVARRLSASGADVYDFAPARDGEQVAYSVKNAGGGMDLWLVRRDGSQNHLLIDCAQDVCSQPAWSPDGSRIVYYRVARKSGSEATTGVWTADAQSGKTDYLFPGSNPSFSPDGTQLVMVNGDTGVIRVLDTQTGKGVELQEAADAAPAWFPDSAKLVYAGLQISGEETYLALFQADLRTRQVSPLLAGVYPKMDLNVPSISPDGNRLLVGMRAVGGISSQQLWVMNVDGSQAQEITRDPQYNHASYSWDPWGSRVVFQQSEAGAAETAPQVLVWERKTGKTRVVAEQATLPEWWP